MDDQQQQGQQAPQQVALRVKVNLDDVDRIRNNIQVLENEEGLWKWIDQTKKMLERVDGLAEDKFLLEPLIGGKINHEKMKKKFIEGNETGEGFKCLEEYLEKP